MSALDQSESENDQLPGDGQEEGGSKVKSPKSSRKKRMHT